MELGGIEDYFDLIKVGNANIIIFVPLFHLDLLVNSFILIHKSAGFRV